MSSPGVTVSTDATRGAVCECGHTALLHAKNGGVADHCYVSGCACDNFKAGSGEENMSLAPSKGGSGSVFIGGGGAGWNSGWYGGHGGAALTPYVKCEHPPTAVIKGDGWGVWAGAKHDIIDSVTEYDVVLNCTGSRIGYEHQIPLPFYDESLNEGLANECIIDWDDMKAPKLAPEFWVRLVKYLRENKLRALVFCMGGHGRTGTAIVSLLIASGWRMDKALKWIRKNYCEKAVETEVQMKYLKRVEQYVKETGK